MNLDAEIRQHISRYLVGILDADALFGFLVSCMAEATSTSDGALRRVWGAAMGALSDLSAGETVEQDARYELAGLIQSQRTGCLTRSPITFTGAALDLPTAQTGATFSAVFPVALTWT